MLAPKYSAEDMVCISPRSGPLDESTLNDKEVAVFVNPTERPITRAEIETAFVGRTFVLLIDGICVAECSRLLLPVSTQLSFTEGSFAALTDSSMPSYFDHVTKTILENNDDDQKRGLKLGTFEHAKISYAKDVKENYLADVQFFASTETPLTHLNLHAILEQVLKQTQKEYCDPVKSVAVAMTADYYRRNLISMRGEYIHPPSQKIVSDIQKELGPTLVVNTYDMRPINKCPF